MTSNKNIVCGLAALGFATQMKSTLDNLRSMQKDILSIDSADISTEDAGKFISLVFDYKKRVDYVVRDLEDTAKKMDIHCGDDYLGRAQLMEGLDDFRGIKAELETRL